MTDADHFNWSEAETVLPAQQETTVYRNPAGGIVIRQWGWPEPDQVVVLANDANALDLVSAINALLDENLP